MKNTAARDGFSTRISMPKDPGQAGVTQVLDLTRKLSGYSVHSSPESGDKVTRAEPLASQVNVGNVLMLRGPWNEALRAEMTMFPNGKYDDQIDALSRAFARLLSDTDPTPLGVKVRGL
jgi:predicted phage terminase large subunit-like protein